MKSAAAHAKNILRMYWDERIPVDPEAIAKRAGATVFADSSLDGLSGMFDYENFTPVIRYKPDEPAVRRRFTIAHELGHYVLGHKGVFRDPKKNFSSTNYDPREVACNKFAAELLMPELAIKHAVMELNISDVKVLAAKFDVSEVAMKYRLGDLGWIS